MRPIDEIEHLVKQTTIKTNPTVNAQVLNDLLDQLPGAPKTKTPVSGPSIWRTLMKTRMTQLTAAAAVLVVIAIVWTQFTFVKPTFAEVVRPLLNAQTIVYDFIPGPENEGPVLHDIVAGSRIRRTISTMGTITMILDIENARMLHLESGKKAAQYFDLKGPIQFGTQEFLNFLRTTIRQMQDQPQFSAETLGTRDIGGRKTIGFAAGDQNMKIQIWADIKTSLPVRIEMTMGPQVVTLKNFQFDVPVDEALVSMDIPAGYTLEKSTMDLADATEEDFIASLKVWAEVFLDGRFPEGITNDQYMKQVPLLEEAVGRLKLSAQESEKLGISFVKGMMFISLFPAKGHEQWHYAGSGVKLGDAAKAIFWYRPKDAQNYRVVYGDLHTEDVSPDRLPK
jgi:outer membrane lipoprotein-sorting protein